MATATAAKTRRPIARDGRVKATRRPCGEPRRLLLESGRELFSRQGFSATSTREIADHAGVSETLMFRYFGSKAGLFREALVEPFVEYVETLNANWESGDLDELSDEGFARKLIGDLFDLFRKHRGLVVMLWAADGESPKDLAGTGIFEIEREFKVLASSARSKRSGVRATRCTATTSGPARCSRWLRAWPCSGRRSTASGHRRGTRSSRS